MILKPNTVTVYPKVVSSASVESYGAGVSIKCQITPMGQGAVLRDYGLELSRPHLLLTDANSVLTVSSKVVFGTRAFRIITPPAVYSFGRSADHASVVLEELDHA